MTRVVALLRAESDGKGPQVGLEATEDGSAAEAEAVVLALTHNEALVVYVAGGLYAFGWALRWRIVGVRIMKVAIRVS